MIREEGFQIIHCHGARANLTGAILRRKVRVPIVTTVHSDYRLDYLGRPLHRLTYGTINTIALRMFDYHIGVSDAMAQLLISRLKMSEDEAHRFLERSAMDGCMKLRTVAESIIRTYEE